MNEPKKRGRPSKAELAARNAQVEGGDVIRADALALVEARSNDPAKGNDVYEHVHSRSDIHDIAQAYAERVWAKQSPSLERGSRLYRVKLALEAQGLSMDGVVL